MGCGSGWRPYAEILLERCAEKPSPLMPTLTPQAEFVAVLAKPRFERKAKRFRRRKPCRSTCAMMWRKNRNPGPSESAWHVPGTQ